MTLRIAEGAVLLGSTDGSLYPLDPPLPSYGIARDNSQWVDKVHRALLYAENTENLVLEGDGVVDGQGAMWWAAEKAATLLYQRPRLVQVVNSTGVTLRDLTLRNSPFWTTHLVYSRHVTVDSLRIVAPRDSPNTDGIDVDSTSHVLIRNCTIDVGDDAVAVKSGIDYVGRKVGIPSEDIEIVGNRILGKALELGLGLG